MPTEKEEDMNDTLQCEDCGWIGEREECIEKYRGVPLSISEEVELYLECPKCNSENLITLDSKLIPV